MKMQEKQKTQEPVLQLPLPKDVTLSDSIPPEPRAPMCKGVFGSLLQVGDQAHPGPAIWRVYRIW